jgi:hypothetical protein
MYSVHLLQTFQLKLPSISQLATHLQSGNEMLFLVAKEMANLQSGATASEPVSRFT